MDYTVAACRNWAELQAIWYDYYLNNQCYFVFQAAFITDSQSDDDSDTVTFHDALSDEEDVLIEDLELDEDFEGNKHRKSDIDIDDFSLG